MLVVAVGAVSARTADPSQRFRIHVHEDGVYRVGYAQVEAAGLRGPVASDWLALANLGRPVPVRIDDGGDGRFEPGDSMVFVGEHLGGETGRYHDFSPFNVYVLSIGAQDVPVRMTGTQEAPNDFRQRPPAATRRELHLEQDLIRLPVSGPSGSYDGETLWYWKQLNHLASAPTGIPIDLAHLDHEAETSFSLKLRLRGASDSATAAFLPVPDHVVDVSMDGRLIGQGRWNGRDEHLIEIPSIPTALIRPGTNEIQIRLPMRRHQENPDPIIDVVYLDWLKIEFPRDSRLPGDQERVHVPGGTNTGHLRLEQDGRGGAEPVGERVELFADGGFSAQVPGAGQAPDSPTALQAAIPVGEQRIWIVPDGRFRRPPVVELDRPSNLAASSDQRDYFIITHASLAEAVEPLARFHDRRGTRTELVDVQDIYDEFNFGIKHPKAIRDFLAHARDARKAPAPTLVLLVGDASWFAKAHGEATAERKRFNERDLIPTWQLRSRDGPAASDNPYVTLVGGDLYPDMAIGRFPAGSPAEVRSMVAKTVAYMENPEPGPWRSRVVLASDPTRNLSARNQPLAERARAAGLTAMEILADGMGDLEQHQHRLRSALDAGTLVMHFFGHGGRFMWQTAPSRGDAGDLFDMDDLDLLAPSNRLPIVLSMSCATGPFDHPAADSLAEKFLRMPDRGAVAVLAASARNSPSVHFTNLLLDGILEADTIGEAVRIAKRARMHPDSALFYNLFGDPALVPARPKRRIQLAITRRDPLEVEAHVPFDDFEGHAEVKWTSGQGRVAVERMKVTGGRLVLRAPEQLDGESGYSSLAVYIWDADSSRDGSGVIALGESATD